MCITFIYRVLDVRQYRVAAIIRIKDELSFKYTI